MRELFADPARWIQQASARDRAGSITDSDGPEAVSWCAWGAVDHLFPHRGEDDTNPLRFATAKRLRDAACRLRIARGNIVRATASDQPRPTELILINSRLVGEPVKINVHREFLARAIKLGCREIGVINPESIVTCGDDRRKYLVMPLSPDKNAKQITDSVRIESGTAGIRRDPQRRHQNRERQLPCVSKVHRPAPSRKPWGQPSGWPHHQFSPSQS